MQATSVLELNTVGNWSEAKASRVIILRFPVKFPAKLPVNSQARQQRASMSRHCGGRIRWTGIPSSSHVQIL